MTRTRIPFVHAAFPDPTYTRLDLTRHFTTFWKKLHKPDFGAIPQEDEDGLIGIAAYNSHLKALVVSPGVMKRINRRADRLLQLHLDRSPMARLPEKDVAKLEPIRRGVDLVAIPSEHRADEIAAQIHEEYPWLAPETDLLWQAMRHSAQRGDLGFRLPPLILDVPPGIGKSACARDVAKVIGVPGLALDTGGESAGFGILGMQRGWSRVEPGQVLNLIFQERIGNHVIMLDEIEKVGEVKGVRRRIRRASLSGLGLRSQLVHTGKTGSWTFAREPMARRSPLPRWMAYAAWAGTDPERSGSALPAENRARRLSGTRQADPCHLGN